MLPFRRPASRVEVPSDEVSVKVSVVRKLLGSNDDLGLAAADLVESVEQVSASTVASTSAAETARLATSRVEQGAGAVAGAASQMSTAMHEVSSSASQATMVTAEASEVTAVVRSAVERLATSTAEIGGVVQTVSGISDRTRMLALNATIEAARAGTAGRGFAVVAEEVKNLAALTSEATTQIGDQLSSLAVDSENVRHASERIDEVLQRIDSLQQTIAAAVEEQTAAIAEITRSASEAAEAAQDLDGSVGASLSAAQAATEAVVRSREWLRRVADVLAEQRTSTASISGVQVHPLRAAITAHAGWKAALRTAIESGQAPDGVTVASAARADGCAFGVWLASGDGEAGTSANASPAREKHARFHREAARVLEAALGGRAQEARTMLADTEGYAGVASDLTDLLVAWLAEVDDS